MNLPLYFIGYPSLVRRLGMVLTHSTFSSSVVRRCVCLLSLWNELESVDTGIMCFLLCSMGMCLRLSSLGVA